MDTVLWFALPFLAAAGSAVLAYFVTQSSMQSKMEIAVSREREAVAEAHSKLRAIEEGIPDKVRLAEESAQRKAFDQFLMDFRVEERRYLRESKNHMAARRAIVMQERLFFRNIPLSNWVEHEMPLDEGVNLQLLDQSSVFAARTLPDYGPAPKSGPKYLTQ
jgi:hypothetical protein